ncbi:MAG: hypothetical protein JWR84_2684 [Caulobacter sp.]|nr:hypothetical protein [Caulobacter sp.]
MITRRRLLIATAALPLAGCSRGVDILVEGPPSAPLFRFRTAGLFGGKALAFPGSLTVGETGGREVWRIYATRLGPLPDVTTVRYGQTPPGATQKAPPEPLRPGVGYIVEASGQGYLGAGAFRIEAGRLLAG